MRNELESHLIRSYVALLNTGTATAVLMTQFESCFFFKLSTVLLKDICISTSPKRDQKRTLASLLKHPDHELTTLFNSLGLISSLQTLSTNTATYSIHLPLIKTTEASRHMQRIKNREKKIKQRAASLWMNVSLLLHH